VEDPESKVLENLHADHDIEGIIGKWKPVDARLVELDGLVRMCKFACHRRSTRSPGGSFSTARALISSNAARRLPHLDRAREDQAPARLPVAR